MTQEPESAVECAEEILTFVEHGWRAIRTLQAQCRLLQDVPPVPVEETEELVQRIDDFKHAIAGMREHLRTLHDVIEHAEIYSKEIIGGGEEVKPTKPRSRRKALAA